MRTLLFRKLAVAASFFLFTCYCTANETLNHTFQLQSFYQPTASDNKLCLMTSGGSGEVTLSACSKQPKPDGLLIMIKSSNDYYTIRPANNSALCLRTFAGTQRVKLDNCQENNETLASYSSMRYWIVTKPGDFYILENKYKNDSGSLFSCLSVLSNGESVGVGECSISGSDTDYNNRRIWQLID